MEMVDHRHSTPANAEGGMHIGLRPFEHFADFVPIGDIVEFQMLNRGTRNDQAVELLILHLLKRPVKLRHMRGSRVLGPVFRHADQRQVDLQRCRPDQPRELIFRLNFLGHQVQQPDAQGPDVLPHRLILGHDHDAFLCQDIIGGQVRWDFDRHIGRSFSVLRPKAFSCKVPVLGPPIDQTVKFGIFKTFILLILFVFGVTMIRCFLFSLIVLAGCTGPDLSKSIKTFSGTLEAAEKPIKGEINAGVKQERLAARNALIQRASSSADLNTVPIVYGPSDACDRFAREPLKVDFSECVLEPEFRSPSPRGSKTYQAMAIAALNDYAATLNQIATSSAPGDIATNFEAFLGSLNGFAAEMQGTDADELINPNDIAPLTGLSKSLTEAYRYRILRRLINDAHDPIRIIVSEMIAASDSQDQLVDLSDGLIDSYADLESAQDSKDAARYQAAASKWEADLAAYRAAVKKSQTGKWVAVWNAQQALKVLANKPIEPEELVEILENVKLLTD